MKTSFYFAGVVAAAILSGCDALDITQGKLSWGTETEEKKGDCPRTANCNKCSWSWPKADPYQWLSPNAKFRCSEPAHTGANKYQPPTLPSSVANMPYVEWGEDCPNLTLGECTKIDGCAKCTWSWYKDDPQTWKSEKAMCRCKMIVNPATYNPNKPLLPANLEWGVDCHTTTE